MAGTHASADTLALSVHGPAGVLDLAVPAGATAAELAQEYARQAGLGAVPLLHSRAGVPLPLHTPLDRAGVGTGALLVATAGQRAPVARPGPAGRRARRDGSSDPGLDHPGAAAALWCAVAAAAAALAGWAVAGGVGVADGRRTTTVLVLAAAAVLGVLPVGRRATSRLPAAPAFAGAAAFAAGWDPHAERLPMVAGLTALAAALAAAVGRAMTRDAEEALRVWIVAGAGVFLVTGLATLAAAPPRVAWGVLLVLALLAARFAPSLAVAVPDQHLVDVELPAVAAWSAPLQPGVPQPGGPHGRWAVPVAAVEQVAARGTRLVTAAAAAVLAVTAVAAPLLLATAGLPVDRTGARCLVALSGASLLLAARNHRHACARALLRSAGLVCCGALLVVLLAGAGATALGWLALGAPVLGAVLVVAAVASGRGWRSAWWSRRAEVVEEVSGALALAALLVAAGGFRQLWEVAGLWTTHT